MGTKLNGFSAATLSYFILTGRLVISQGSFSLMRFKVRSTGGDSIRLTSSPFMLSVIAGLSS